MELNEFIMRSLIDVRTGVRNANEELKKTFGGDGPFSLGERGKNKIEFDIAVTSENNTRGKVGGGIKIAVVSVGSDVESNIKASNYSRIKFAIYPEYNFLN